MINTYLFLYACCVYTILLLIRIVNIKQAFIRRAFNRANVACDSINGRFRFNGL